MEEKVHKYISANYKLYDADDTSGTPLEETTADNPFTFITGFDYAMPAFEKNLMNLAPEAEFDFVLAPEEAFGEYVEARVISLDKAIFCIDGIFDSKHIYPDAIITLRNDDGNTFMARIISIGDNKVKADLNHPFAGKRLRFKGTILEHREATNKDIENLFREVQGQGGCGNCGGHCGEGHCGGHGEGHCGGHGEGHCGGHGEGHGEGHCGGGHGEDQCCGHHGKGHCKH